MGIESLVKNVLQEITVLKLAEELGKEPEDIRPRCLGCGNHVWFKPVVGGFKCPKCGSFHRTEEVVGEGVN